LEYTDQFAREHHIDLFYLFPKLWLQARIKPQAEQRQEGLADAMDMLSVCATAGLRFDQSLQQVSEYWDTPIGRNLGA
jgi:tight adherence protein C